MLRRAARTSKGARTKKKRSSTTGGRKPLLPPPLLLPPPAAAGSRFDRGIGARFQAEEYRRVATTNGILLITGLPFPGVDDRDESDQQVAANRNRLTLGCGETVRARTRVAANRNRITFGCGETVGARTRVLVRLGLGSIEIAPSQPGLTRTRSQNNVASFKSNTTCFNRARS